MSRRIAAAAIAAAVVLTISAVACSDDDGGDEETPASAATPMVTTAATSTAATAAATQAAATPGATTPAATAGVASEEVRGIVGAVNSAEGTIEITRLSGADVTRIGISPTTEIRRARGGTATLSEIRPSDRIIATGAVEDGVLEADRITVEDVVPGAQPGG